LVIGVAILLEVICIWLVLRRARRPRFFVLWLAGMHLITYPAFLGVLWMLPRIRPALAVAVGEGLVVVVEGIIIYLFAAMWFRPNLKSQHRPWLNAGCFLDSGTSVRLARFQFWWRSTNILIRSRTMNVFTTDHPITAGSFRVSRRVRRWLVVVLLAIRLIYFWSGPFGL